MSVLGPLLDRLTTGALAVKDGVGFILGNTPTLPTCAVNRDGEHRWVRGAAGVADREVVCEKDASNVYAWQEKGAAALDGRYVLIGTDPNADRIYFWDDSAGAVAFLSLSAALSISGTTLSLDTDLETIAGLTFTDGLIIQRGASALEAVRPAPTYVPFVHYAGALVTWTNMPLAITAFNGDAGYTMLLDSSNMRQIRLFAFLSVAPAAGADLVIRTSPDLSTFTTAVTLDISPFLGGIQSAWTDLPAASIGTQRWFHLFGQDGNGAADPQFRQIYIELR